MNTPSSTYRIQFNHEFTFADLQSQLEYLHKLGVSTIYASPILEAVPGSMHGYDTTDSQKINPEIGKVGDLKELASSLKKYEMNWLQDIVPNHMSFSVHNKRLMDVLERGDRSEYYRYFDILWGHPQLNKKLILPILTESEEEALSIISIHFTERGLILTYGQNSYPISIQSLELFVTRNDELRNVVLEFQKLEQDNVTLETWNSQKAKIVRDVFKNSGLVEAFKAACQKITASPEKLKSLLELQHYRLMPWQTTDKLINYRRFFTVNELIGLRMEDEFAFKEYHQFLLNLFREDLIQGIRIDHIDGLYDPLCYCKNVRTAFGPLCYIIAEKILAEDENLPHAWPLQGTSGYEFLAEINQLFTDKPGVIQLTKFYQQLIPQQLPYADLVIKNKKMILENHMAGEWDNLLEYLFTLELDGGRPKEKLKAALGTILISMPVYRIYPSQIPLKGKSWERMMETFVQAKETSPLLKNEIEYFESLFMDENVETQSHELSFIRRLMQFTGPLTAKGVEDTTFYSYNPLISHDEVGESPASMALYADQFHQKMIARQASYPLSLNTTSTHDTKRGEDARLRLNVLSEIPENWKTISKQWLAENHAIKIDDSNNVAPTINDQYFIYQTILGGFPTDLRITAEWRQRLKDYFVKVVREGKVNSDWAAPNKAYEEGGCHFIDHLFVPESNFLDSFIPFLSKIDEYAMIYSLGATLIKITSPGIPDTYQGSELFNHSFVDPDNRRKVDFDLRKAYLHSIIEKEREGFHSLLPYLKDQRATGIEKLYVTYKSLEFRKSYPLLFTAGEYLPLQFSIKNSHSMAYARVLNKQWAIIVIPLNIHQKRQESMLPGGTIDPARILFPPGIRLRLKNIFTGEIFETMDELTLGRIFKNFPVALLTGYAEDPLTSTLL